jgi:hypothetical protein
MSARFWPSSKSFGTVLVFATLLFSSQLAQAQAQFSQQGPKLVGTGAVGMVNE